jgi:DNA-binding GntR family transcriptional regulator
MIRDAIMDGTFPPGAPLVEATVAEFCGVSRTPVREAFTRLEQDGLLDRGPRGLIVRERSPEEILDIYETRVVVEAAAARAAAERHTSFDLLTLSRLQEICENADPSDSATMARANAELHRAVWHAGRNQSLIDLLDRLSMHLGRYPSTTLAYPGRWQQALQEHREIIKAIESRDGERAAELARDHFQAARDVRLLLWRSSGN